jgi:uncharacterized protein (TIGR02246 family)
MQLPGSVQVAHMAVTEAPAGSKTIREVIETNNRRWNEAFNRGDAAGVAALYAADAMLLPPTKSVVSGAKEIQEFWSSLIKNGFGEHSIELIDACVEGNLAYEAARWQASATTSDGGKQSYSGNLVNIFKRQPNGDWKSQLHTWN